MTTPCEGESSVKYEVVNRVNNENFGSVGQRAAKLLSKFFSHQNFSIGGLRVSIADFGFKGPGFDSQ